MEYDPVHRLHARERHMEDAAASARLKPSASKGFPVLGSARASGSSRTGTGDHRGRSLSTEKTHGWNGGYPGRTGPLPGYAASDEHSPSRRHSGMQQMMDGRMLQMKKEQEIESEYTAHVLKDYELWKEEQKQKQEDKFRRERGDMIEIKKLAYEKKIAARNELREKRANEKMEGELLQSDIKEGQLEEMRKRMERRQRQLNEMAAWQREAEIRKQQARDQVERDRIEQEMRIALVEQKERERLEEKKKVVVASEKKYEAFQRHALLEAQRLVEEEKRTLLEQEKLNQKSLEREEAHKKKVSDGKVMMYKALHDQIQEKKLRKEQDQKQLQDELNMIRNKAASEEQRDMNLAKSKIDRSIMYHRELIDQMREERQRKLTERLEVFS